MSKRTRRSRRSRRSRKGLRGLGCVGCGPSPMPGAASLRGLGQFDWQQRVGGFPLKTLALAALAFFAWKKMKGSGGLGAIFLPGSLHATQPLNRPLRPGDVVEIPRGF